MAFEISRFAIPGRAASAINAQSPVALLGAVNAASALDNAVIQATTTALIFGVARASAARGAPVQIDVEGVVKCRAAASFGAGAPVGPASGVATDGLVPIALAAAASQIKNIVGYAMENEVAGNIFSVYLAPRQLL